MSTLGFSLDDFVQTTSLNSLNRSLFKNLYGFNHRQSASLSPLQKENYGFTFFVKPQLNLQGDNIRNVRQLYPYLNKNPNSIHRFTRCNLDPRLMRQYSDIQQPIICPVVDDRNPFISVLTNNLISITGWPDMVIPTFTSPEGVYKETYSQPDGIVRNFKNYELNATLRVTRGDPITHLFYLWLTYMSHVLEGKLVPYPDFIVENRQDYNTRIYRITLDNTKRFVQKIGATGVAFPINAPIGQFFDFTTERPYNDQTKEITIQFNCSGFDFLDDILILEFNKTMEIFNSNMRDNNRNETMIKIESPLLNFFNYRGYPRINQSTFELEWWIEVDVFHNRMEKLLSNELIPSTYQDYLRGD